MPRLLTIGALILISLAGCRANLEVRKVSPGVAGDTVKGFRYYLGRPYLVVKKPILISERIEIISISPETRKSMSTDTTLDPYGNGIESSHARFRSLSTKDWETMAERIKRVGETSSRVQPASFSSAIQESDSASSSGTADPPEAKKLESRKAIGIGDMEIVYLPDLDEQYAVHDNNRLGKSAYSMSFRDGWELVSVNGEFDSSAVAVEILNTVETAIKANQSVATASFEREKAKFEAATAKPKTDTEGDMEKNADPENIEYAQRITRTYIKPGVFRINKPWEMDGQIPKGDGLLAKMGLSTYQTSSTSTLKADKVPFKDKVSPLGKPLTGPFK